jgi:glycolate oxidase
MKPILLDQLRDIVGPRGLLHEPEDTLLYSYDASLPESTPEAIVFPTDTDQISRILALANGEGISVVPRGAGTGLSGGSLPMRGGIVLCLNRMNRIIDIDTDNLTVEVEPGVINLHLQQALAPHGLFYPPDPASMKVCTLGGNVAENAGGPRCLKYGVTRNYVLGLEVVLSDGEVIHTGGYVMKNTTGYDMTQLFVGSEGTLGVITKMVLRVMPVPEAKRTMLALFDSLAAASRTVSAIIAAGIIPATLEMLDNLLIRCAEDYVKLGLPTDAAALLLIEVDGAESAVGPQAERIVRICEEQGATEVNMANSTAEVDQLWLARRTIIGAVARVRPSLLLQDVTVPRSKLPDMVQRVVDISERHGMPIGVLAHAGDGNLHPLILFDARDKAAMKQVKAAEREIFSAALELGGTLTGEHGIGVTKMEYLDWQFTPREMELTRQVKALFDPAGILNPNKIAA